MLLMPSLRMDDGGHEASTETFVVAGYVAPVTAWDALEKDWEALAKGRILRLAHICGVEGHGPFASWSKSDRNRLVTDMAHIVDQHLPQGIARAVYIQDYKDLLVPAAPMFLKGTRARHLAAVGWCLRMCLEWLGTDWLDCPTGEKIDVIFEEGTRYLGEAITFCRNLKRTKEWGKKFGSIATDSKDHLISLQAADFLAYHCFQYFDAQLRQVPYLLQESFDLSTKRCKLNLGILDRESASEALSVFTMRDLWGDHPL